MAILTVSSIILLIVTYINCVPIVSFSKSDAHECLLHFNLYPATALNADQAFSIAIAYYQRLYNITSSGILDKKTIALMKTQKCVVRNIINKVIDERSYLKFKNPTHTQFSLPIYKMFWRYRVEGMDCPYGLNCPLRAFSGDYKMVYLQAEHAFNLFGAVTNISFQYTNIPWFEDIDFKFTSGSHAVCYKDFDGRGPNPPIHVYYQSNDFIHVDDDEDWVYNYKPNELIFKQPRETGRPDLIRKLIHITGRIVRMQVNNIPGSIMNPAFMTAKSRWNEDYKLPDRDIDELVKIYGLCRPQKITTVFSNFLIDGKTYFIIGRYAYQMDDKKMRTVSSWPRILNTVWKGIPEKVDEIFTNVNDGFTYFFANDVYYYLKNGAMHKGPKIKDGWKGLPDKIDAAFVYEDSSVYFFKGALVYKWDKRKQTPFGQKIKGAVATGFPKNISDVFPGVPSNIDSAFRWYYDGRVYFFKGDEFWVWDSSIDKANKFNDGFSIWQNLCEIYRCIDSYPYCRGRD